LERARRIAEASGSSLDQLFLATIVEKVGGGTATLGERAAHADVEKARGVPDAPLVLGDEP
jgi:hypothetical protein